MSKDKNIEKAVEWYTENRGSYESLCNDIVEIIEYELNENKVFYNSVSGRAKEVESYHEKCKKDKYNNPIEEISDMSGIRITAYTNSDVEEICNLIEQSFDIDFENSVNKKESIAVDQFGYLSVHYTATLPNKYFEIRKYHKYKDLKFEIQVRTLLQHAWSEIEHDRNYKFNGALPNDLKRRFYMIAGVLELVDREFESLTKDIEKYSNEVVDSISVGNLKLEFSKTSLVEYLGSRFEGMEVMPDGSELAIIELRKFGIRDIEELDKIVSVIPEKIKVRIESLVTENTTVLGLVRDILIYSNADEYFLIWDNSWGIENSDVDYFRRLGVDISQYNSKVDQDEFY